MEHLLHHHPRDGFFLLNGKIKLIPSSKEGRMDEIKDNPPEKDHGQKISGKSQEIC
jgi:hypothetical protein